MSNSSIYRSWIFGAGLVLGYAILPRESGHSEAQEAFALSQQILQRLSDRNPQARRNHVILRKFADTITSYHTQGGGSYGRAMEPAQKSATSDDGSLAQPPGDPHVADPSIVMEESNGQRDTSNGTANGEPATDLWASDPNNAQPDSDILDEMGFQQLWEEYSALLAPYMLTMSKPNVPEQWSPALG